MGRHGRGEGGHRIEQGPHQGGGDRNGAARLLDEGPPGKGSRPEEVEHDPVGRRAGGLHEVERPVGAVPLGGVHADRERGVEADRSHGHGGLVDELAETVNGLYKTELVHRRGPWRTLDQVELATAEWVSWWNERRLHGACGDIPPAEFEAAYYRALVEGEEVA